MKFRPFGKHGFKCSEIGFGAWAIGGSSGAQADNDSLATPHPALDRGCNFIDTAAGYGNGRSERLIGQVLRERTAKFKASSNSADGRNTNIGVVPAEQKIFVATKTHPADGIWPPS